MKPDPKQTHVARELAGAAPLICCRFDPSGKYLFTTAEDQTVNRVNLTSGESVAMLGHDSWARDLAFSKDGKTVVSSGFDDTLIWWPVEAEKPKPIRSVKAHKGWIRTVSVSPDGRLLASGGNDRIVRLWNMVDGKLVREMPGHTLDIYSSVFHPSGKWLLTGDLAGKINQWDVATGKLTRVFEGPDLHDYFKSQQVHFGGVRSLTFSPDGKQLVGAGLHKGTNPLGAVCEPLILRFDWETGKQSLKQTMKGVKGVAWRIRFLKDGTLALGSGGSGGGYLGFWNGKDEAPIHNFKLPRSVREMDLHPDGMQIATAHWDNKARLSRMEAKAKV